MGVSSSRTLRQFDPFGLWYTRSSQYLSEGVSVNIKQSKPVMPSTIDITVSKEEALFLALLLGSLTWDKSEGILTGGDEYSVGMYESLRQLFAAYYPQAEFAAKEEHEAAAKRRS